MKNRLPKPRLNLSPSRKLPMKRPQKNLKLKTPARKQLNNLLPTD